MVDTRLLKKENVLRKDDRKLELFGKTQKRSVFRCLTIKHKKEKRYLLWNNGGVSVMFWGCFATSGIGCRKSVQNLKTFKGILEQSTPAVPCQKARSQDKDLEPAS